jgi:hypothetical protein
MPANSSISSSDSIWKGARHLAPWLAALALIFAIEYAIAAVYNPLPADRTNFLNLNPLKAETVQRAILYEKLKYYSPPRDFTIMQAGDSSGFYGIRSRVVEEYLPKGTEYVNFSCCANMGYRGYYALLDYYSKANPALKYFVLYVSPTGLPRDYLWYDLGISLGGNDTLRVFGHDVAANFTGWRSYLDIASLALRRQMHTLAYFWYLPKEQELISNKNYLEYKESLAREGGWWMPKDEAVNLGPLATEPECVFPDQVVFEPRKLGRVSLIEYVFSQFAELARERGVQLVIAFQPVPCKPGTGAGTAEAHAAFARFRTNYPEVIVPFDFTDHWPASKFTVPAHVNWETSYETSRRLGAALKEQIFSK